jgi:hypothetical protein
MSKPEPNVKEHVLEKNFGFTYSNFVISSQHTLYLLLSKSEEKVDVLEFEFSIFKYGHPNDEVGHPLTKYGLGVYGFFEVLHSNWIEEMRLNNSSHHSHSELRYNSKRHFVARFQDLTLEIVAQNYSLKSLPKEFFIGFLNEQIDFLDDDD